jgi:hypothetical protein
MMNLKIEDDIVTASAGSLTLTTLRGTVDGVQYLHVTTDLKQT